MKQQLLTDSVLCGSCSGRPASSGSLQGGREPSLFRVSPGALHTSGSNREDFDRLLFWNPGTVSLAFSPPRKAGKSPPLPPSPTARVNFHFSNSWSDFRFASPCFPPTANYTPGDSGARSSSGRVSYRAVIKEGRTVLATRSLRRGNDTRTTFVKYIPCKISTKF